MRKQYLTYDGPDASERVSDIFRFLNQGEMSATESCCFSKGDVSFYTISCEKYYFRVGSNLTITLSLFVKGNHIDIYVNDHQTALELGRNQAEVYLVK